MKDSILQKNIPLHEQVNTTLYFWGKALASTKKSRFSLAVLFSTINTYLKCFYPLCYTRNIQTLKEDVPFRHILPEDQIKVVCDLKKHH